ncbi:MAG: patatin-like phospholipase family protein, partial [Pseudomonadota bacterium]
MRRALLPLLMLFGCAPWNPPQNQPLQGENAPLTDSAAADDLYIGLAFSGGGMRATAFAYGMLQELRAAETATPHGLLDNVRLVSGVSGGSVMAAQIGLNGPQGMTGFREAFLTTNAEAYMTTSGLNPLTIAKGIAGGVNGRDTFGRTLDETLFHGATFADLR